MRIIIFNISNIEITSGSFFKKYQIILKSYWDLDDKGPQILLCLTTCYSDCETFEKDYDVLPWGRMSPGMECKVANDSDISS